MEEKNWTAVRRLVGYDRYTSRLALETLNRLYGLLRWHTNFFQPVMQLQEKTRNGAKVHKVYDTPQTPYQRLLKSGILSPQKQIELAATYRGLNPVRLLRDIAAAQEQLWARAERAPRPQRPPASDGIPTNA